MVANQGQGEGQVTRILPQWQGFRLIAGKKTVVVLDSRCMSVGGYKFCLTAAIPLAMA